MSQDISKNEEVSLDSLLQLVMIDIKRKVKVSIKLVDEDGDEVSVGETIEQVSQYISDKLESPKENTTSSQVFPLMAQSVTRGLSKLLGGQMASLLLSQEMTRYSLIHMMSIGFYLWNVIHKNGFKIETTEEPVSQEDIDSYRRLNKITDVASTAAALGADPREMIRELLRQGHITRGDIQKLGAEDILDDIPEDKKDVN